MAVQINTTSLLISMLFCGMILFGSPVGVMVAEACPRRPYCEGVEYMTCGNSATKLPPLCNCSIAPKGCTLYRADGTSEYCGSVTNSV